MKNNFDHIAKIVDAVARAYTEAVYFTDTGDSEQPAGDDEMSTEAVLRVFSDCADFLTYCEKAGLLAEYISLPGRTWDSFGHDFWFTRNGHGVGFWDRGDGEIGDKLTEAAETFGHVDTYLSDAGEIEFF